MMVGVASQEEMRAHHIQIWPPSCRSTTLESSDGVHIELGVGMAIYIYIL